MMDFDKEALEAVYAYPTGGTPIWITQGVAELARRMYRAGQQEGRREGLLEAAEIAEGGNPPIAKKPWSFIAETIRQCAAELERDDD